MGVALLAVKDRTLVVLVEDGLKDAVRPAGSPVTARATALAKPLDPVTVMVLLALPPGAMVRLADEALRVKLGDGTLTSIDVESDWEPEVPLTITLYFPGGVFWLALRTKELELLVVDGLKVAVTPAGRPVADNCTFPLKPFSPMTRILLLALPPAASTSELSEVLRLMVGVALGVAAICEPEEQPAIMASVVARQRTPTS